MKLHRCRDCQSVQLAPEAILCPKCKEAALERQKVRNNERRKRYYNQQEKPSRSVKHAPQPHKCKTCDNIVAGQAVYCEECGRKRKIASRQRYEEHKKYSIPTPAKPVTSLDFLKGVNAHLKENGGVYVKKVE